MSTAKYMIFILFFFIIGLVNAQTGLEEPYDSTKVKIDVIDIPGRSASAITALAKIEKSVLTQENISQFITSNVAKILSIDSLLQHEKHIDLDVFNKRHLINKKTYWAQRLIQVEAVESVLAERLQSIEEKSTSARKIAQEWHNISQSIEGEYVDSIVSVNIQRVISYQDSLLIKLIYQRGRLLEVQDKAIHEASLITAFLEQINERLDNVSHNLLVRSKMNYGKLINPSEYTSAFSVLKRNLIIEGRLLSDYMKENGAFIFLFMLILIIGIIIFKQTQKAVFKNTEIAVESYYQVQFRRLLFAHRSTAFVLVIWFSALIFPNQPLLFKDIVKVSISIPLLILLYHLINRELLISVLVLFALVFVKVIVNQFPPDHIIYGIFVFIAALCECFVLVKLIDYVGKKTFKSHMLNVIIKKVLQFALLVVGLVLILGLFGYFVLAELVINVVLTNTFSISLLFVSMLIVNGLIEYIFNSSHLNRFEVFKFYGKAIKTKLIQIVAIITPLTVVYFILLSINAHEPVVAFIREIFTYQFSIGDTISFSIGRIVLLIIVLSGSVFISNVLKMLLEEDVLSRTSLDEGLPHTIALLAKYSIITIGVSMAISMAGLPMQSLTVLIGAFGVGIGFGLQNIFNNLVSGLILLFERPIKIDDVIEVGQFMGKVKSIGIRSSIVRTFDGAEVIVPNGQLISSEVINWTHSDHIRRHEILVGVAYGSDVEFVKGILEEQIKLHEDILIDPAPSVLFLKMGDSSLDFRLLIWISRKSDSLKIKSELTQMIYNTLNKEGIEIPFPQRDVHIINDKN